MKRIIIALFILAALPSWAAEEGENLDGLIFWADSVYYKMSAYGTGGKYQLVVADREMVANYIESNHGTVPFPAFDEGFCKGTLTIPDSVEYAGNKYMVLPLTLEDLENPAVKVYCYSIASLRRGKFHSIDLGVNVRNVYDSAFDGCENLTRVEIPRYAFLAKKDYSYDGFSQQGLAKNSSISHIAVHEKNQQLCDVDGVLFSRNKAVLHRYPMGKADRYEVPEGVRFIADEAFSCDSKPSADHSRLKTLVLSGSVEGLGDYVFRNNTTLREIHCQTAYPPVWVVKYPMGDRYHNVFTDFENLSNCVVYVPKGCKQFYADDECWGKVGTIIETNKEPVIPIAQAPKNYSLARSELVKKPWPVTLADSIYYQINWDEDYAYVIDEEKLQSFYVADGYYSTCDFAYTKNICKGDAVIADEVKFEGFMFPVKSISSLKWLGVKSVTLSDNVESVGWMAFSGGAFSSIHLGNGVKSIGQDAFSSCKNLTEFYVPRQLTDCHKAFFGNYYIREFKVDAANPAYCSVGGALLSKDQKIFYKAALSGSENYEIPDATEEINDYAFSCGGDNAAPTLKSLTIGRNVRSIGTGVFLYNNTLEEIRCISEEPCKPSVQPYSTSRYSPSSVLARFTNLNNCVLRVPKGCKEIYANDELWGNFRHIEEFDSPDSIETLSAKRQSNGFLYDLSGRRVADSSEFQVSSFKLPKGMYIQNGKKVVIK